MKLNPWYRCECGKLHVVTLNLGQKSVCTCGREIDPFKEKKQERVQYER